MKVITFFIVTLSIFVSSTIGHTPGTVSVDQYTFDKIIRNFDVVLAKFDDKYPYGDKQDQFKSFAQSVANTRNLLIAEIPITDYGDKENEQLAKEYGVTKADFPAYKLFLKGKSKPIDYTGEKTENDLKRFLSQHTNLWFGLSGTLESFDKFANEFYEAAIANDQEKLNSVANTARDEQKKITDAKDQKSAEAYLKIMEATIKQGADFLKREERRVQNLLKGKITNEKKQELQYRANILLSFRSSKDSNENESKIPEKEL